MSTIKRKISISRMGMRGSLSLLAIGIIVLGLGIFIQYNSGQLPDNSGTATATITGFYASEEQSAIQSQVTVISFAADGKQYTDVKLGQYQASWNIGDTISIHYSKDNPTKVWTTTMRYSGILFIVASIPFLSIGAYKIIQFTRIKIKNKRLVNEVEEDSDEENEKKFRRSTVIIPFAAGVPFTLIGVALLFTGYNVVLPILITVLGCGAIFAGCVSLAHYFTGKKSTQNEKETK